MSLPFPYALADGESFPVKVFRDHPAWAQYERWWQLPVSLLSELLVQVYEVECEEQLDWLEKTYPGHVFVY